MNVSPQEKQWHCDHCPSAFGRLDHLKRHLITHNPEKSNVCQFCRAVFSRGDVLRRHWKSCKERVEKGEEIPETQRGGKHKRACDSCANIRKACNGEIPCLECIIRGRTCTYRRLDESAETFIHTDEAKGNETQDVNEGENPDAEDIPEKGPTWNLGLQNFYPSKESSKIVYSRNRYGT